MHSVTLLFFSLYPSRSTRIPTRNQTRASSPVLYSDVYIYIIYIPINNFNARIVLYTRRRRVVSFPDGHVYYIYIQVGACTTIIRCVYCRRKVQKGKNIIYKHADTRQQLSATEHVPPNPFCFFGYYYYYYYFFFCLLYYTNLIIN